MTREERRAAIEVAFRRVFGTEGNRSKDQLLVHAWLSQFCRKRESTFVPDSPRKSGHLEGRREVLLEIERRVETTPYSVNSILGITSTKEIDSE